MFSKSHKFYLRCMNAIAVRYSSSTVDAGEIKHHNQFAKEWWDKKNGPMKALHAMNDLRIQFIRTGLMNVNKISETDCEKANYLKDFKILDVGCGGGILSVPLARLGGDVIGLDASSELIEIANNHLTTNFKPDIKLKFVNTTIEEHSATHKETYDVLILSEVIEHISLKELFLQHCIDTLKPGGSVFITTLNRTNLAWFTAIFCVENILNIVPRGTHEWTKLITPDELKNYLKTSCKVLQINGMLYIPFRNVWCWIPQKTVCFAAHAVKRT
ncbi:ubiquinone biosynthesis protein COQ3, mitochondrial isoform X2 [Rhodnius prolixus]|uniref:ubiquinone biosynthesis protein COQ3, mitochondrial isoform X2 n=1 Tax=Rhodnius prolixus TaxID=13249 RepID=UPI003D18EBA0